MSDKRIVDAFTDIPEVSAIYRFRNEVTVFTSNPKYDRAVMDRLLDAELTLPKRFGVEYLPDVLATPRNEYVRREAAKLFERETGDATQ